MVASPKTLVDFLPLWYDQLQQWSLNGRLSAAAQEALLLDGEPQPLKDLVSQWSAGEFGGLPPIVLLSAADINGALGAYAISTSTIYLNVDWLVGASKEQVFAVLTEELGHHLDGLLNAVDTPGDEGEYFAGLLGQLLAPADQQTLVKQSDQILIQVGSTTLLAEAAMLSGTALADTLIGGFGDDTIDGLGGNDTIDGQAGSDLIRGGDGNDTIQGNFGNDTLYGDAGDDVITDDQGSNILDGGTGNDSLTSRSLSGNHSLIGGTGNDNLNATGLVLNLDGGDGDD